MITRPSIKMKGLLTTVFVAAFSLARSQNATNESDTCQPDAATCITEFYFFGFSENDNTLSNISSDDSSPPIILSENFYFYGQAIRVVYVSDNGIISLGDSYNFFNPRSLPINDIQFIAPYWADFDLTGTGNIFYRQTRNPTLLARATNEIRAAFPMSKNVIVINLLIATWDAVGYFNGRTDKTNTLQCILATTLTESFVIFLYADGEIQWTTGDDSGGVDGIGGNEALAGINGGDGVNSVTIPGSMTPSIVNITQTSNVGIPGVWIFKVGEVGQPSPHILSSPSGFIVEQRQDMICSISVPSDVDPDTIELGWLNEDDIITDDSRVTITEQSDDLINISSNFSIRVFITVVQFDPVVEDDEGNYSCYSIVNETEISTSIQLQTRIPNPDVQIMISEIEDSNASENETLTIGDPLTLDCTVTAVRGISSSVDIIWTTGGRVVRRVDNITADIGNDSAIYTDSFEIPSLSAIDNGRAYQCTVWINASPVALLSRDQITLMFPAPVCFSIMNCEEPVNHDLISFAHCCFDLSAVSYASAGQCLLCPTPDCTTDKVKDVVFLIGSSGSHPLQLQMIREFVDNIAINVKLSSPESSVGVILFGGDFAWIYFNLEAHTRLSTLSPAINPGLPLLLNGQGRDTAAALHLLLSSAQNGSLGIRNDTSHIAIVITGGRSNNNIQSAAAALHAANIFDVYAIGYNSADIDELNTIASDPDFVYFTNFFDGVVVEELQMNVTDQLCSSTTCSAGCFNGGNCTSPEVCTCPPQWTGSDCTQDIDECTKGTSGCDHNCTNTDGSYYCTCMDGYELKLDNHTCTELLLDQTSTIAQTETVSPTVVGHSSSDSDNNLSDNEVIIIAVCGSVAGIVMIVLTLIVVLLIRHQRRNATIMSKLYTVKPSIEDSNKHECFYPNSTFQDVQPLQPGNKNINVSPSPTNPDVKQGDDIDASPNPTFKDSKGEDKKIDNEFSIQIIQLEN